MQTPEQVIAFWFGTIDEQGQVSAAISQRWWQKDNAFDQAVQTRFGDTLIAASQGECASWLNKPLGRLAAIILLDQFTRNIYRGNAQAFAFGQLALTWAEQGIALQQDRELWPIQRVFFYLPFEHAENFCAQQKAVALFTELSEQVPAAQQDQYAKFLDYAHKHKAVIDEFGRFPHRNAILGRESTPAELAYLAQPGAGF